MKSIRNLFTPLDFFKFSVGKTEVKGLNRDTREMIVDRAQKLIDEYLDKEGMKVYIDRTLTNIEVFKRDEKDHIAVDSNFKNSYYTGLVVDIQPIEKNCEHEAIIYAHNSGGQTQCKKCGVALKPKGGWEAVDE